MAIDPIITPERHAAMTARSALCDNIIPVIWIDAVTWAPERVALVACSRL
jgi:hypothetical protein